MVIDICTTYYDPQHRNANALNASLSRFGSSAKNLGAEMVFDGFLRTKLVPFRAFVADSSSEVVAFIDGNDTISQGGNKGLLSSWKALGSGVVIGSELVCWPHKFHEQPMIDRSPNETFHFMDTGLIMGRREAVLAVLDTVIASVPHYREKYPMLPQRILEDDVGLFMLNYVDGNISVTIDHKCSMIAPLRNVPDDWYEISNHQLHMTKTGTTPNIVHCNGHRNVDARRMKRITEALLGYRKTKIRKANNVA